MSSNRLQKILGTISLAALVAAPSLQAQRLQNEGVRGPSSDGSENGEDAHAADSFKSIRVSLA